MLPARNSMEWLLHGLPRPGEYLSFRPLQHNGHIKAKKYGPCKKQIRAPKLELRDEEIANLLDAEFKILVIRMLIKMVECGHKIEKKVKAMKREIKGKKQGTYHEGRKPGLKSKIWSRRKK